MFSHPPWHKPSPDCPSFPLQNNRCVTPVRDYTSYWHSCCKHRQMDYTKRILAGFLFAVKHWGWYCTIVFFRRVTLSSSGSTLTSQQHYTCHILRPFYADTLLSRSFESKVFGSIWWLRFQQGNAVYPQARLMKLNDAKCVFPLS